MQFSRPRRLRASIVGLLAAVPLLSQQQPAPQQPKPPNPFEQVPQAQEPKPQPPKPEPAKPATPATPAPDRPPSDTIESINFQGARKVPQDTLRAMIFTKKGDNYDPESLHRDFITLWNSARFDDIQWNREPGQTGWIITFKVVERPVVRTIKYD